MRVVVAGGAGFLGSHLCRALLARGDQVVCMDNLITGDMDNVSELFGDKAFTFVHQDVSNYVHVSGRVDAIMNLASPASPVDYLELPIQTLKVGSLGTHHLLGMAKERNAPLGVLAFAVGLVFFRVRRPHIAAPRRAVRAAVLLVGETLEHDHRNHRSMSREPECAGHWGLGVHNQVQAPSSAVSERHFSTQVAR